jgi:hypothetical protein
VENTSTHRIEVGIEEKGKICFSGIKEETQMDTVKVAGRKTGILSANGRERERGGRERERESVCVCVCVYTRRSPNY